MLLEQNNDLRRIQKSIDVKHEIAAYIRKTSDIAGPALIFDKVKGFDYPVVGGVFANRRRALLALECTNEELVKKFGTVIETFSAQGWFPPVLVRRSCLQAKMLISLNFLIP
jgi:UbiD family decarboxylase